MCQTEVISNTVVRLGRRSYTHRMEVARPNGYGNAQLARLNRELDALYELIYDDWNTVTEEDYAAFGPQFVILLQTLRQLYTECRKAGDATLSAEVERLGMNYSALYELNSDIVNFRIKAPHDLELKSMMSKASQMLNR